MSNKKQALETKNLVANVYEQLFVRYGLLAWWPADTPFEVMIGAILTQNTSWGNVEKAITSLKSQPTNNPLNPVFMHNLAVAELATLIRSSGFFNIKAARIMNFLDWYRVYDYDIKTLKNKFNAAELRSELLQINGIGRETADSILLYALDYPAFVIDAYTRRIFSRLGLDVPKDYDTFQQLFTNNLQLDTKLFSQYHALIVQHAKQHCKATPSCLNCPLRCP